MFSSRHIGVDTATAQEILAQLGFESMDAFIKQVVPKDILHAPDSIADPIFDVALSESDALAELRTMASKNKVYRSFIGQGYYSSHTPAVITHNVLQNPAWYTAYTPYQAEISQGRLEALLNFQTMVVDLSGMEVANASLLDEASAAAEAMLLCYRLGAEERNVFFVDKDCFAQTIAVVQTRAQHLGIKIIVGTPDEFDASLCFGCLLQYPGASGKLWDYATFIEKAHAHQCYVVMAADLLALALLKPPGALGADVAVGSTQRFGMPLGCGGPHAAYIATLHEHRRRLPGRIVGVSMDSAGEQAYCLILQTREQHIRREKAISNICTAQALPAIIASFYALYHGSAGIKRIATEVHGLCCTLAYALQQEGFALESQYFFDTLSVKTNQQTAEILQRARRAQINLRKIDANTLGLSLDETTTVADAQILWRLFTAKNESEWNALIAHRQERDSILPALRRTGSILNNPIFNRYHSETHMRRYMRYLADKDLALDRTMIPLGSCTMKLNAASEMSPISWSEFADIHPLAPMDQLKGYQQLVAELEKMLCVLTGYVACSVQPNAGSQGEYSGLLAIKAYHNSRGDQQRDICLIPVSAHGTNPATARMCNLEILSITCDKDGNINLEDLKKHLAEVGQRVALIMLTYPSTHGVFEPDIVEICRRVHDVGGLVYIDGANLNAMVGLCLPGLFGGDVSHLNLHKTFCIPHGGGGPGVGPVMLAEKLRQFLPADPAAPKGTPRNKVGIGAVAAARWGSAGILPISWMYLKMMGCRNLRRASEIAILNANYIAMRLKQHYPILYKGQNSCVAHECIVDLRPITAETGIEVEDVAKRLMDYGFHAPTISFPVAGAMMIEPTESECKEEIDRFCDAMIAIRKEILAVARGELDARDNPLKNAPHTIEMVSANKWTHSYTRQQASQLDKSKNRLKYWTPVARINYVRGDRNPIYARTIDKREANLTE